MDKIIVIISEGGSEVSFIEEFIKTNYGYKDSDLTKGQKSIEKGKICIYFSHPKQENGKHGKEGGGDSSILKPETYIKINGLIKQNFSHLLNSVKIIYLIQTDINKKNEKETSIKNNIKFCHKGKTILSFASMEIESWFIVGLGDLFKKNHKIDETKLKNICKKDVECLDNVDDILDDILLPSGYSGTKNVIGREFGKYIDIEQAKTKSPSFKKFIEIIDDLLK